MTDDRRNGDLAPGPPIGLEALSFEDDADGELVVLAVPMPDWKLPADLTRAETEVARAVLSGASAAQIAAQRGTSVHTVANQLQAIYQKAGVSSRTELAVRCVRRR